MIQAILSDGDFGDLIDCDVIVGRYIVDFEWIGGISTRREHGGEDVINVNIGFALFTIPQNSEASWVSPKTRDKIVSDPMCLSRPHYICKAKGPTAYSEHMTIRGDKCFAGEFACPIS